MGAVLVMDLLGVRFVKQAICLPLVSAIGGILSALPDLPEFMGVGEIDHEWYADIAFLHKFCDERFTGSWLELYFVVVAIIVFVVFESALVFFAISEKRNV